MSGLGFGPHPPKQLCLHRCYGKREWDTRVKAHILTWVWDYWLPGQDKTVYNTLCVFSFQIRTRSRNAYFLMSLPWNSLNCFSCLQYLWGTKAPFFFKSRLQLYYGVIRSTRPGLHEKMCYYFVITSNCSLILFASWLFSSISMKGSGLSSGPDKTSVFIISYQFLL